MLWHVELKWLPLLTAASFQSLYNSHIQDLEQYYFTNGLGDGFLGTATDCFTAGMGGAGSDKTNKK